MFNLLVLFMSSSNYFLDHVLSHLKQAFCTDLDKSKSEFRKLAILETPEGAASQDCFIRRFKDFFQKVYKPSLSLTRSGDAPRT